MSYEIRGPSIRPLVSEAQSLMNNGGGGNLGYFQRNNKNKKDEQKAVFESPPDEYVSDVDLDIVFENLQTENHPNDNFWKKLSRFFKSS